MSKKSTFLSIFLVVLIGSLIFILGFDRKDHTSYPLTVYQVYLEGKSIGIIQDEEELYNLIDKEQNYLKDEYNVSKIYAPNSLETTKLVTYSGQLDNVKDVYNKIKDVEPFTVKGYEITITHSEDDLEKLYVLKKEDFDIAIENTVKAFVDEETYNAYIASTQQEIKSTGSLINNIEIKENITIKEKYLSTDEKIYTDSNELSRYLLFSTTETQGKHFVSAGETISDIANEYELSVNEFLIVNPEIISSNSLLFPGQEVNVGLINPLISIVIEKTLIEDKEVTYGREIKYDNKLIVGTTYTEQTGQNGLSRVTYYTESINGVLTQVIPMNTNVITPVINEVVVKGGLSSFYYGETGSWYWPTVKPYYICSEFGWRTDPVYGGRAFHRGTDICGVAYSSPIYAVQAGVVTKMGYASDMGNYIYINHGNGFVTIYMHQSSFYSGIRVGTVVTKGQQIGYVGSTGKSTGTHLHIGLLYNGTYIDPMSVTFN